MIVSFNLESNADFFDAARTLKNMFMIDFAIEHDEVFNFSSIYAFAAFPTINIDTEDDFYFEKIKDFLFLASVEDIAKAIKSGGKKYILEYVSDRKRNQLLKSLGIERSEEK